MVKSAVIREIHHRVKNNLQTIGALLRMQIRRTEEERTKEILRDVIGRINSIAIVHEALSQQDGEAVNVAEVAERIYRAVLSGMVLPGFALKKSFAVDDLWLSSDEAMAVGLILNELLQNALEHGFAGRKEGAIAVKLAADEAGGYCLSVTDDGKGVPPDFELDGADSLGLKIIRTMTESDLHGRFTLIPLEKGTLAQIEVPGGKK